MTLTPRPLVLPATALTTALLAAGCGSGSCTDIGALSGITFDVASVRAAHPQAARLTARGCAGTSCRQWRIGRLAPDLGLPASDGFAIPVTLTVTDRAGAVVFRGRLVVHPKKQQPNGPSCPPTAWSAQLRASGSSRLRQVA